MQFKQSTWEIEIKTNIKQWRKSVLILTLLLLSVGCATDQQKVEKGGQKDMSKEAWDTP